jgi:hypothetical protein
VAAPATDAIEKWMRQDRKPPLLEEASKTLAAIRK